MISNILNLKYYPDSHKPYSKDSNTYLGLLIKKTAISALVLKYKQDLS